MLYQAVIDIKDFIKWHNIPDKANINKPTNPYIIHPYSTHHPYTIFKPFIIQTKLHKSDN